MDKPLNNQDLMNRGPLPQAIETQPHLRVGIPHPRVEIPHLRVGQTAPPGQKNRTSGSLYIQEIHELFQETF
jgi:hypothetical protein